MEPHNYTTYLCDFTVIFNATSLLFYLFTVWPSHKVVHSKDSVRRKFQTHFEYRASVHTDEETFLRKDIEISRRNSHLPHLRWMSRALGPVERHRLLTRIFSWLKKQQTLTRRYQTLIIKMTVWLRTLHSTFINTVKTVVFCHDWASSALSGYSDGVLLTIY